jgi:predicted amidohydrolase YtcJ
VFSPAAEKPVFRRSEQLDSLARNTAAAAIERFGKGGLAADKIAITVIDLGDQSTPARGSYRGDAPAYPASVVKLFYLVAAHHQVEIGALARTAELERAMHDMIVDSSNEATAHVVDLLTGTTSGPELDDAALRAWLDKRNLMNRYFASLGYDNINLSQKTWCEGPYGRDRQGLGAGFENRNRLTTDAVARLWYEIVTGRAASPGGTHEMLNLLHRDPWTKSEDPDDQATAYSGKSLPPSSQYYSKAGWTSETRHDTAYIHLPNGAEYILATFTTGNSKQTDIIPFVSQLVAQEFSKTVPNADLALINGRIWTGNAGQPWAEAMAARGERLIAVGANAEIRSLVSPATRVIDLQGKLALPGFIDDHTHFIDGGFQLLSVDLRDAGTQQEFARRIAEQARKLGPNRWVTGGNWDHELWPGAPLPTRELIDAMTPQNPVFVSRLDGHMGLANSVALRLAGITRETHDAPGGTIVHDAETGAPTGVLKDAAQSLIETVIPKPSDAEYDEALGAALAEAARVGVTSIQDITLWDHYPVYQRFRDSGRLTVRIYARMPMSQWKRQAELVGRLGPGDSWVRLGGLKAFMDGSLGSTTALFFDVFNDSPNTSGLIASDNLPEGKLLTDTRDADKAGLQCSIHAIGDKANHLLLGYFEEVEKENGLRDRRFRIEHAQHVLAADIPRFAQLGVIPSMQPAHAIDDGRWAEKRIGPVRIKTTYAFRSLLDSGASVAFGTDWPVAPLDPLIGIYAAVTRQTTDGRNPRGWVPEQKISVEEAVRAYTAGSAYAEFGEREKGSLEPGKLADVVVLSQDIFRIDPEQIRKTKVVQTIVGGRVIQ